MHIRQCDEEETGYVCEANVEPVGDAMWIDIFVVVNNHIADCMGTMV